MLTTPSPRPWMPLYRRRAALAYTTLPRKAIPSLRRTGERRKRPMPGGALVRRLYTLLRYPPALTFRLDELTAETETWSAERPGYPRPHR